MGNQRFQKRSEFFIRRLLILLILLLTLPLALAGCGDSRDSHKHAAEHGTLDLRNRSFLEEGAVALNGEWAFYPRQLLTPEQLASNAPGVHYVDVPKSWNSYPGDYGLKDGMGFATYRLTVRIDPTEQVLALRVPNIYSAYKLWINGELLTSEGTVGTSRQSSKAEQYPSVVAFKAETGQIDIVAQVSNFQHRKGGIWVEFRLGGSDSMLRMQKWSAAQDMVIFGSLLIIGIYHIGLYAFRRQEKFTIHFGLLCLIVALRAGVTGDSYLLQFFPISWETGVKLGYISLPLCAISGYLYVYRLFPQDASRKAIKAIMGIGFVLTFFVLIVPAIIYSKILLFYQLFALVVGLYCLVVLVIARMNRREGASFVLAGMGVFVLTVFNDVFFYNEWLVYAQLVPLGLFFFILMQSFIISTRFSSALRRVELVSNELRELNAHLEERIEERTDALKQTNQTLEEANRELGRMETSRRHLMTNISHDLRTPITLLQGYLEAIQDGVVSTEEQRQRYVRMMLGKVGGLERLIHDLFELSKLEAGQLHFDKAAVSLEQWREQLCEQYEIDVRSAGLAFECEYIGDKDGSDYPDPQQISLQLDLPKIDQVMANLVYNAIKHTQTGGKITLSFSYRRDSHDALITVSDTGIGIEAEHLPYIFDRFYKKEISRNSADGGSGLGLAIAKEIVEAHGGKIGAKSEPGIGTTIWIALPAFIL